jgi:DUF2075 family protein
MILTQIESVRTFCPLQDALLLRGTPHARSVDVCLYQDEAGIADNSSDAVNPLIAHLYYKGHLNVGYYETKKKELEDLLLLIQEQKVSLEHSINYLKRSDHGQSFESFERQTLGELQRDKEAVLQMAKERQLGFPWLAKAYDEYFALQEQGLINYLHKKAQPAFKAAEIVKQYSKLRRDAERRAKRAEYLIEYYEYIAPFLVDLKEEVDDAEKQGRNLLDEYSEEEIEDAVTGFLTKEEYRKLSTAERNQLAMNRFWNRSKSKWLIGRIYERYVGYLYERDGYDVEYVGIFKGFEDLGRDLICKKDGEFLIIQCKNWSQFRTIYEKHIFQFFGTVFQYRDANPHHTVRALFYTATELSDLARRFSSQLEIELYENFKLDQNYPCIKCNVSWKDGTKIYHLPFDQQYDRTTIDSKRGEFYCATVKEAEEQGFRRAFRYRGPM